VTPSPNDTAYNAATLVTCDQANTSSVARIEHPTIRTRPPHRSSQRPAGTAASAAARSDTVWAPVTAVRSAPSASCIGTSSTANA
jgi:hypothetical protein